jgi:hypothetical protein
MKKLFFMSAMLFLSIAVCYAAATSLTGQWHGTLKTDDGSSYPLQYSFKVEGNSLTGTAKGPHGDLIITDGEVHGSDFTFMVTLSKMHLLHSGRFYPDSVSLDIENGDAKAHTVLLPGEK